MMRPLPTACKRHAAGAVREHKTWRSSSPLAGIPGAYEGALRYVGNPELISRTHFARYLVEQGGMPRYLRSVPPLSTEGEPGFVPHRWARLGDAVRWIREAGGAGGDRPPGTLRPDTERGICAVFRIQSAWRSSWWRSSRQPHPCGVRHLRRHGARGSGWPLHGGSDFPQPPRVPHRPGATAPLPTGLTPVWELLQPRIVRA